MLLASQKIIDLKVFYTFEKKSVEFDSGFGRSVNWDIPLLKGYDYAFISNNNRKSKSFWAVRNPGLIKAIENYGATTLLVIGWNYKSHLNAIRYFKNKIPVLFRGDSNLLDETKGLKKWLRQIFLSFVYSNIDCALYVGNANKQYYLRHGLKPAQLKFAPHAIDNCRFENISKHDEEFIKSTKHLFGIVEGCVTIVFCGKLQEKKNPALLISAVKLINNANLHLIIVGSGELEKDLKLAALTTKNIHFLPFQNQTLMPAIYRLGEIFCLPSQGPGETWGLAVNEAMACSRAIIVSNKCGCAFDLVKNDYNGFIFESENLFDLSNKLKIMINDKVRLFEMGINSNKIIKAWDFEAISNAIYEEIQSPKYLKKKI